MGHESALHTRARLRELAVDLGTPFDRVLGEYGQERALARLADRGGELALRGGSAIAARLGVPHRRLRRLELLFTGEGGADGAVALVRSVSGLTDDDLFFDPATFRAHLPSQHSPSRVRVRQFTYLAGAEIPLEVEVDLAAGTRPGSEIVELPSLVGRPPLEFGAAPFGAVAADCIVEIARRDRRARRMADYYDLWFST